jgi:ATP-dependent DNA helicase RecQ
MSKYSVSLEKVVNDLSFQVIYSPKDIATAKLLIEHTGENDNIDQNQREEQKRQDYIRLNRMINYCKTTKCLRSNILDYFGQSHEEKCNNCGNCHTNFVEKDVTIEAQKILSCIKRIHDKIGYYVGANIVAMVLHGSEDKKIIDLGLNTISTYKIMADMPRNSIREIIDHLIDCGYIIKEEQFSTLRLEEKSRDILYNSARVYMQVKFESAKTPKNSRKNRAEGDIDSALYDKLRKLRHEIANEQRVPAFVIFSNATLSDMAAKKPRTINEFLDVSGVGTVKAAQYGEAFVAEINRYINR